MVTKPRHVPPIVEPYPPGSSARPVRGQMSARPLTWVTTHQQSAFDLHKHWNKLRDGGERGERGEDGIKHVYSTLLDEHMTAQDVLTNLCICCASGVLRAKQKCSVGNVQWGGRSLCMLQYVSLLWWKMMLSKNAYTLKCGTNIQFMERLALKTHAI